MVLSQIVNPADIGMSYAAGDLNFYVPLARYGLAQSAHQVVLHYWFDQYLDHHGQGAV